MKNRKYNSYSTDFKLAVISGKQVDCNYNNKYYWNTKGKDKILQAIRNDEYAPLADMLLELNSNITEALDALFSFIHRLVDRTTKTQKLFKSSRGIIVSLWEALKHFVKPPTLCKWFRISESTFFSWKNRIVCKTSYTKECPNIYPNQLRDWERLILEDEYFFNAKYVDYSISDLLGQVMADRKVIIGESLFYEYASLVGETERRKVPRKKRTYKGLRAQNTKDIIHMDKSKFAIKNTNGAWANLIADNRSRAILGFTVSVGSHSKYTLANLKQAITKHHLLDKSFWLVTDDGSENKGEVKCFVKENPNIKHKIAQKNIPYSNSMIESVIKQLKYRYLPKKNLIH
jgi:putative transposase